MIQIKQQKWQEKMVTNSNPFQMRLNELSGENSDVKKANNTEIDPFQKRLDEKENLGSSLWNSFYDMIFSPEESALEYGIGSALRGIGTSLGGLPGDTVNLAKGAVEKIEEKFPTPQIFKRQTTPIQKMGKEVLEKTPTTQSLTEKYDQLTQGKYIPKDQTEALLQEMGGDIATLLLPASSIGKTAKAISGAILGNLAKEGMKELEFGEGAQAGTKIGTIMAISMFNPSGAVKFVNNLYETAYANLPKEAQISAATFSKNLNNLKTELKKGLVNVESKKPVLNAINDIKRNIKKGNVSIRDLTEAKRNLNEQRTAKIYDPEFKGDKKSRAQLKKNYSRVAKTIDDAVEEYGKNNESFYKPYREAQQAWGGMEQSKKASQFINRTIKNYKLATSLGALAGLLKVPGIGLGGVGAGYTGLKSYELMHRIMMNPTLRKYYINTILEASKESAPGVINNLKKMDSELKKTNGD